MFLMTLALAAVCGQAPDAATVDPALLSYGTPSSPELVALFERGSSFEDFLGAMEDRREMWETNRDAARIPEDVALRVNALEGRYRVLVVTTPGCTDSSFTIPALARLAFYSDALDLRIVTPEEGGQAVMDERPTMDGRAATPTVVVLNEAGDEVGCWIERPVRQRDFYLANMKGVERGSESRRRAVRDFLGWYREDNGATAQREFADVLAAAETGARGCGR